MGWSFGLVELHGNDFDSYSARLVYYGAGMFLIYLAALKTVPNDLYELLLWMGEDFARAFFHVIIPTIKPLIMIQLIFVLIGAFQSADNVLVMTGGGPDGATNVIGLEILPNAYVSMRFELLPQLHDSRIFTNWINHVSVEASDFRWISQREES